MTLTSNLTINPNTNRTESDIITGTALRIKNNSALAIDVYVTGIESSYNDYFLEYNDPSISWRDFDREDTLSYIAFSIEGNNLLPYNEIELGSIGNKWDSVNSEKIYDIDAKSGYSWKLTDNLNRVYPITLVFKVDDEDISQYINEPKFTNFVADISGDFSVDVYLNEGIISERGFLLLNRMDSLDITTIGAEIISCGSGNGNYFYNKSGMSSSSNYIVRAYAEVDGIYYYSNELVLTDIHQFKFEIDLAFSNWENNYYFKPNNGSFYVSWGDGIIEEYENFSDTVVHSYSSSGAKSISIIADELDFKFGEGENFPSTTITKILTSLPYNPDEYGMRGLFYCQLNLRSIPSNLFENNKSTKSFSDTFWGAGLDHIPDGLFKDCTEVEYFGSTF